VAGISLESTTLWDEVKAAGASAGTSAEVRLSAAEEMRRITVR
jgi:hypothetical protein